MKPNYRRLEKLAAHLETGKLGHGKFDFDHFNRGTMDRNGCGTSGCALGECPIMFPRHWKFSADQGFPVLKTTVCGSPMVSATQFFGISYENAGQLFNPDTSAPWNKTPLWGNATRHQVAAAIRRFIKWSKGQP